MKNNAAILIAAVIVCLASGNVFGQAALVVDVDPVMPGIQTMITVTTGTTVTADVYLVHDGIMVFDSYAYAVEYNDVAGILTLISPTFFDPSGLGITAGTVAPVDVYTGGPIAPGGALATPGFAPGAAGPGGPFMGSDGGTAVMETGIGGFFSVGLPAAGTLHMLSSTMFTAALVGTSDVTPIGLFIFPPPMPPPPGTPPLALIAAPTTPPWPMVSEFYDSPTGALMPAGPVAPYAAGINPATVTVTPSLAVELVAFVATVSNDAATLRWTTASETNNAGFNVEMKGPSEDARFESVQFVDGMGSTSEQVDYATTVALPEPGTYVFRLRQTDLDGSISYSDEVEVTAEVAGTHRLALAYPNPFSSVATLSLAVAEAQEVRVDLFNVAGEQVRTIFAGTLPPDQLHTLVVDGAELPNGLYLVRIIGRDFIDTASLTLVR